MEIKKSSSVATIIQRNTSDETETKSAKTTALGISKIKDGFEVVSNNENRSAHQTKENSGKKELSPEEQQRVSNFVTTDLEKPTFFVQTSESKSKESENSGLEAPFSQPKTAQEELKEKAAEDKKKARDFSLGNTLGNNNPNENVNQLLDGSNLRDTLKNEMAERHEEIDAITGGGGSPKEKLTNAMDITPEPEKSEPTYGKGMISQSLGIDPTPAEVEAAKKAREAAEKKAAEPPKAPKEPSNAEKAGKFVKDVLVYLALTKTPVPAPPMEKDEYENFGKGIGSIIKSKDRTPESEAKKGGGGLRSYDYENYKGGTPEQIQKHMDYLLNQYRNAHKNPGGQEIQEDPNAVNGGTKVNDPNLHVFELGNTGLVGQPDTTREPGSIGGSTQPGGFSGGDVDFGPDSDETGFNGTTHQDDRDIQFGPSSPPEQIAETEEEEEAKNKKTRYDSIRTIRS